MHVLTCVTINSLVGRVAETLVRHATVTTNRSWWKRQMVRHTVGCSARCSYSSLQHSALGIQVSQLAPFQPSLQLKHMRTHYMYILNIHDGKVYIEVMNVVC